MPWLQENIQTKATALDHPQVMLVTEQKYIGAPENIKLQNAEVA